VTSTDYFLKNFHNLCSIHQIGWLIKVTFLRLNYIYSIPAFICLSYSICLSFTLCCTVLQTSSLSHFLDLIWHLYEVLGIFVRYLRRAWYMYTCIAYVLNYSLRCWLVLCPFKARTGKIQWQWYSSESFYFMNRWMWLSIFSSTILCWLDLIANWLGLDAQ